MAEVIVTMKINFKPQEDGSLIPPVNWDFEGRLRKYGIPGVKVELLNVSPVRYEDGEEQGMCDNHQERTEIWQRERSEQDYG